MIIRIHRFHGYNSLRHVYSHGQTVRNGLTALKYSANPRRGSYRAAVVVSRKVHKSAVVRNRVRRRIYECIRLMESRMAAPYDLVITVFSDQVATMPAAQLNELIHEQLTRAGIVAATAPTESHAIVEHMETGSDDKTKMQEHS